MVKLNASGSPDNAGRVVDSLQRSIKHAESEYVVPFSVPTVMDTVSKPAELEWSDCLAWVAPKFDESGTFALSVATSLEDVQKHYEWVGVSGQRERYDMNARLATDWWVIWDTAWIGVSPFTGKRVESEAFSLHFTDGRGISAEMTSIRLQAPDGQTQAQRNELLTSYFDAVGDGDVDRVMSLFSPTEYAGSAVREYFGDDRPGLAALSELDELRHYYERFRKAATVTDVTITNWYIRDWYFFAEAQWQVELASGERGGITTAEVMLLASDGAFAGRMGWGKPFTPQD
ncbi:MULTISPECIES: hypothetical protein [Streptomyces]|uniref:Uncharacterized protein n=1 Tax=Streptomyces rhizosphaericus TaxID=114699 RepID=A0A6G4A7K5_9ACTN|nr:MULTISPECIES: hypothetical protein [Streptomyces]EXU64385.1 hypothetical protein Z951_30970 [Streptomyces sp. PRh5]NEW69275.1 hypothetical protein [Streptomyces rhizosphaericus]TMU98147.1 hypothetical protein FGK60_10035 [Streptomyces sp. DASNCL29]